MRKHGHWPALDGLRGISILLVIVHNIDAFSTASGWLWPAQLLAQAGWIGVQIFFVLSGFLITLILLDTRDSNNYYRAFFARRALRIMPLYYLVLFAGLIVLPALVELSPERLVSYQHQFWLWTFLTNWAEPFDRTVQGFPHFWSLAVEEQFYLLWPLLIRRSSSHGALALCVALMVAALVIRCAMLFSDAKPEMIYMFTICRMDALAAGGLCALLLRASGTIQYLDRRRHLLAPCGLALGAAAALLTSGFAPFAATTLTYGHSLLAISIALILLSLVLPHPPGVSSTLQRLLAFGPLRSTGKYSYAMYVLHIPLFAIAATLPQSVRTMSLEHPLLNTVILTGCCYLAGALSYHVIEKPFLALKRRFVARDTVRAGASQET